VISVAATGGGDPELHLPLSVEDVIRGLTAGSTATTSRNDTGVLYPGFKADMVVYEKDFYSIPLDKISVDNPRVLATYVGGKEVYRAA
jgi:predicted amidohydrolase YtcJ